MMKVRELGFRYSGARQVLRGIAFEALSGECLAVLGNNGAGKSTMLKCLNRILSPQSGTVYVNGRDVLGMPVRDVARSLAFVAQGAPGGRLTVYDMVMLGRRPHITWGIGAEDERIVRAIMEQMELWHMAARFVDELSGGERQKVCLARALAQEPKVLLLDEPTSNLDLRNQYEALALIKRVCTERDIAVVIVIHDLNLALRFCDKFVLIKDSEVFAHGGPEVITPERIEAVYGIAVDIAEHGEARLVVPKLLT